MKDAHFFDPNTPGWDEAWGALGREMSALLDRRGRPTAYAALRKLIEGKIGYDDIGETEKELMRLVLHGYPESVNRTEMESRVFPGERWQYMGTFPDKDTGRWMHQFRHRHLDLQGGRCLFNFECKTPIPGLFRCSVCKKGMDSAVPSGVCSELCLRKGQGFPVKDDGEPF